MHLPASVWILNRAHHKLQFRLRVSCEFSHGECVYVCRKPRAVHALRNDCFAKLAIYLPLRLKCTLPTKLCNHPCAPFKEAAAEKWAPNTKMCLENAMERPMIKSALPQTIQRLAEPCTTYTVSKIWMTWALAAARTPLNERYTGCECVFKFVKKTPFFNSALCWVSESIEKRQLQIIEFNSIDVNIRCACYVLFLLFYAYCYVFLLNKILCSIRF